MSTTLLDYIHKVYLLSEQGKNVEKEPSPGLGRN